MRRIIACVVAGLGLSVLAPASASTVTGWQRFGEASTRAQRITDHSYVFLASTTKINPVAIRFVVTNPNGRRIGGDWTLSCDNYDAAGSPTNRTGHESFAVTATTAGVRLPPWVASYRNCHLSVTAALPATGTLAVTLQAKYP